PREPITRTTCNGPASLARVAVAARHASDIDSRDLRHQTRSRTPVMTDLTRPEAIPQIAALIKEIDICLFATRGDDGRLHARPMSNNGKVAWDGQSWFFAPTDGRLVAELRADPAAGAAYRAEEGFAFVSGRGRATSEQ